MNKTRLGDIQLMFARIVTGAKRGASYDLLYKETSWPTFSEKRNAAE